jgi:ATP-dependent Clp protease ATP-binding subunit ClpC
MMHMKNIKDRYSPYLLAWHLDWLPHRTIRAVSRVCLGLASVGFAVGTAIASEELIGAGFIVAAAGFITVALDAVRYSFMWKEEPVIYETAMVALSIDEKDPAGTFMRSRPGMRAMIAIGSDPASVHAFLAGRSHSVRGSDLKPASESLEDVIDALVQGDQTFREFLAGFGVDARMLSEAIAWRAMRDARVLDSERWWSEGFWARIHPLGRQWVYGKAYFLEHLSRPVRFHPGVAPLHPEVAQTALTILSKGRGANLLIVGEPGIGKMEVAEALAAEAEQERGPLSGLVFVALDLEAFRALADDRIKFAEVMTSILRESARTGNIIFVIPDLPSLIRIGSQLGAPLAEVMMPFLRSPDVRVIAIADTEDYDAEAGAMKDLAGSMERIVVKRPDVQTVINVMSSSVREVESEAGVVISLPAIHAAVTSAERFIADEPLYSASRSLLVDAGMSARARGDMIISRDDVLTFVEQKTGIKIMSAEAPEAHMLAELEDLLRKRVVGQDEALAAVAQALRRVRAGLGRDDKPLGSFMFLGPTGVGKTETVKALAEAYFGDDDIIRLDMTEYSDSSALMRLIGTYDGAVGTLSRAVRERPYGVLLLDEFEKCHEEAKDLFLQILDEGRFSDAQGKIVSARNLMVIATSNAGADEIFKKTQAGSAVSRKEIIDVIVARGDMKPELLNRFDGIILFSPLSPDAVKQIALLELQRLAWNLKTKGMTLEIGDALVAYVADRGYEPAFGAREIRRTIQDTVEKVIADRILAGTYRPGSVIRLAVPDLPQ